MGLEIFPQSVTLFPNDKQIFTARVKDRTPYWHNIGGLTKGFVQPDFSVALRFPFDDDVTAEGALQLVQGAGSIEWVITSKCILGTSIIVGDLRLSHKFAGPTADGWQFNLNIDGDDILVVSEPGGPASVSLPHNLAVGDRIKVELANGFRLFVNGVLRHERVSGFTGNIRYPATYSARLTEDSTDPRPAIPAPILEGDWQLKPVVAFTVNHGSLSSAGPGLTTEYFNGTIPGVYTLIGSIDPGLEIWVEDAAPAGSSINTSGGAWGFGASNPVPFSGNARLKSPAAVGAAGYEFSGATTTLQISPGDVLVCYVFLDAGDPPTEIMLQFHATDSTAWEHRAYWGANSIAFGIDGTASRRFMGPLPATGAWTRFEIPASLLDLEGRVLNGMNFNVFDGTCSFDLVGKYPSKLQRAEALINMPPLQILGDPVRTIQPAAKFRPQTNYDVGPGVTWSVLSGGGSFSQGEFTVPSAPGTSVLRATSGTQVADLTVNVPAVITPSFGFAAPLETINWDTNIPSPTWSSVPPGINASTGEWTAPNNLGLTVKITVSDGSFAETRDVLILEKFPNPRFATPMDGQRSKKVLVSEAEDGTDVSRVKDKDGKARDSHPVQIKSLTRAEFLAIKDFWDAYHPSKRFIFEDVPQGVRKVVKFDSDLAWKAGAGRFDVAFRVKEVAGI